MKITNQQLDFVSKDKRKILKVHNKVMKYITNKNESKMELYSVSI